MSKLVLKNLNKSFGNVHVIKDVSLDIESGDFCVFVGPSGCGKSTLLRMISGLEQHSSGNIIIDDEDVGDVAASERGVAMVFQSYALYPHMTVRENLSFGLENIKTPKDKITEYVEKAAVMLQLEDYLDRRPTELSGGQRQRVAIGRAVVREPKVFLFDEPLSNLDAKLRVRMRGELCALQRQLGNTMIYVTHDQTEAMTMADKIVVLRDGVLEQYGTPLELFNNPINTFVAGFIGSPQMNLIQATVTQSNSSSITCKNDSVTIKLSAKKYKATKGQTIILGIRPEHITLTPKKTNASMKINSVEQLGTVSYVYGELSCGTKVTTFSMGQTNVKIDNQVYLSIDEDQVHLFDAKTTQTLRK